MAMLWIAASEKRTKRGPKIRNYVAGATSKRAPYILPSITGNIDSHVEFLPSELSPAVGILKIPMDADLKLFDGQHRALGIFEFVRDYSNTEDTISLLLTVGLPLELRQQFSLILITTRANRQRRSVWHITTMIRSTSWQCIWPEPSPGWRAQWILNTTWSRQKLTAYQL